MGDRVHLSLTQAGDGMPLFRVECGGVSVTYGPDREVSADAIVRMFKAAGLDPDLSVLPVEVEAEPQVDWTEQTAGPSLVLHDSYDLVDVGEPGRMELVPGRRESRLEFKLHGHPLQLQKIAMEIQERMHGAVQIITLRQSV